MSLFCRIHRCDSAALWALTGIACASLWLAGCEHADQAAGSTGSVTLGASSPTPAAVLNENSDEATSPPDAPATDISKQTASSSGDRKDTSSKVATTETANAAGPKPTDNAATPNGNSTSKPAEETRTFAVEGPENAIRVSFDDVDLLKVMNLDPVPADAPERLPKWLKALDGKRIRVRGFMYPPFQDTGIRGFVLARDNQICCFGRTPKEYDLIDIFLRKGITTHYIQNRPFDVVGVFRIKSEIEQYTAMYELEDALVIEK